MTDRDISSACMEEAMSEISDVQHEPMSDERLAEIKLFRLSGGYYDRIDDDLVREVERLRAELDARLAAESVDAAAGSYAGRAEEAEARAGRVEAELKKLESILEDACEQTEKARDERDALEEALARARKQNADLIAAWRQGNARRDRLDGLNSGLQRSALEDALEQRTRAEQAEERAAKAEAALAEMRKANDDHPRCCTCGKNLGYRNVGSQLFCWPCADGESPEAHAALERAADEQGVQLPVDIDKLMAGADLQLSDEEFAEWTSAWQCTAPCCSEDATEQGDDAREVVIGAGSLETSVLTHCPTCGSPEWLDDGRRGWNPVDVECEVCAGTYDEQGDGEGGGTS